VERTDLNDEYVENMAVLLQSLDADDGDNIVITEEMHEAFSNDDFDLATISEAELADIIEQTGHDAISEDEAMSHVEQMLVEYGGMEEAELDARIEDIDTQLLSPDQDMEELIDLSILDEDNVENAADDSGDDAFAENTGEITDTIEEADSSDSAEDNSMEDPDTTSLEENDDAGQSDLNETESDPEEAEEADTEETEEASSQPQAEDDDGEETAAEDVAAEDTASTPEAESEDLGEETAEESARDDTTDLAEILPESETASAVADTDVASSPADSSSADYAVGDSMDPTVTVQVDDMVPAA
jgi:hypothetical protein